MTLCSSTVMIARVSAAEAEVGQDRIEADRRVTFAEDEAVAIRPFRIARVDTQVRVIEGGKQLRRRKGAGIVAGTGDPGQAQRLQPDEFRAIGQIVFRHVAAVASVVVRCHRRCSLSSFQTCDACDEWIDRARPGPDLPCIYMIVISARGSTQAPLYVAAVPAGRRTLAAGPASTPPSLPTADTRRGP